MTNSERRLAAIMFTDLVGYSAITHQNEALALKLLDEHRSIVRPILAQHQGREIQTIGDAFFVEFASALAAVQCAIDMQQKMASHRSQIEDGPGRLKIRVGVHLGDVEVRDGDLLGDGVNIASRIEPLAEPGGICISEDVARQVRNKIPFALHSMGKPELKNISENLEIFRIATPWLEETLGPDPVIQDGRDGFANSIAVLPFVNNSPDPDNAYFSDGLTEELIHALSSIDALRVTSRTSTFAFRNHSESLFEIGKQLGVGHILEGSVRKSENRIRVSAQLVGVESDVLLWSESYELILDDIFELQSKISEQVSEALKLKLLPSQIAESVSYQPTTIDAYEEYLKGRFHWNKRTHTDLLQGIEHFERALALDAQYALAHAGMADCYTALALLEFIPPQDAFPKAKEAAKRALKIDSELAEAHASWGLVRFQYDWNWSGAEEELQRAVELKPNYPTARHYYADLLKAQGRFEQALAEMRDAQTHDPLSIVINLGLGHVLYLSGEYDAAIEQYQHTVNLDPDFAMTRLWFGRPYLQKGMFPEAIAEVETALKLSGNSVMALAVTGHAYAAAEQTERANEILEKLLGKSKTEYVPSYWVAMIYIGMGDFDNAFDWLNRAVEERSSWLAWVKVEPRFEQLRSDSRFTELLQKMGLND